jgi:hypothetical protein
MYHSFSAVPYCRIPCKTFNPDTRLNKTRYMTTAGTNPSLLYFEHEEPNSTKRPSLIAVLRIPACYKTIIVVFLSINMHKPLPPFGRAARVPARKRRTSCCATQTSSHFVLPIIQHEKIGEAQSMPLSSRSRLAAGNDVLSLLFFTPSSGRAPLLPNVYIDFTMAVS